MGYQTHQYKVLLVCFPVRAPAHVLSCPVHFHYHDHEYGHGLGHAINMDRDWDRDRERDRSTDRGTNSDTDPLSVKNSTKFRLNLARYQTTLKKFLRGIRLL